MKQKYFKWLLDSCEPRKGPKLVKGKIHETGDYPEHVVDEWVKSKAAVYVKDKPKEEEE
jgi:hypothetical protein